MIHGCYVKTSGVLRVVAPELGQVCNTTENPVSWNQRGVNWRGNWSSITNYSVNDAVACGGSSYAAVTANLNTPPPSANWNVPAHPSAPPDTGL